MSASDRRTAEPGQAATLDGSDETTASSDIDEATASSDIDEASAQPDVAADDRPSRWSLLASTLRRELRGDNEQDHDDGDGNGDGHGVVEDRAHRTTTLPEIVPATVDVPDVAAPGAPAPLAVPDVGDPDEWTEMSDDTVVHVPRDGRTVPFRPVGRRPRVRKVTRVLRHIDPWSTFKIALIFSAILYAVLLTAGVLLWNVALNTGTVDNVERWFTQFGWETFELNGGELYHNAWIAGIFGAVGLTAFAVLCVTLFNLVSDIVGGVRMTVLEEEVVERTISPSRRFVVRRTPSAATWEPEPSEPVEDPKT